MPIDRRKFSVIAIESIAIISLSACAKQIGISLTPEANATLVPNYSPTITVRIPSASATPESTATPAPVASQTIAPRPLPDPTETREPRPPRSTSTATATPRPRSTSAAQKAGPTAEATPSPTPTKSLNDYFVWRGDTNKPNVALTFDDGWFQVEKLLNILKESKTRLTLFPTGQALANPDNINFWRGLRAIGCEFGCHSYTHTPVERQTTDQIIEEINRSQQGINKTMGQSTPFTCYRPPYGGRSWNLVDALRKANLAGYIWSFSSEGTSILSSPWLVQQRIVNGANKGEIVLQHFNYNDVTNMAQIIDGLRKRGLNPTTLREVV